MNSALVLDGQPTKMTRRTTGCRKMWEIQILGKDQSPLPPTAGWVSLLTIKDRLMR
jgi:hypothetical protein